MLMNIMTLARLPAAPAQLSYVVSIRSYAYVRYDTLSLTVFFRIPIVGFSPIHRYLAFGNLRESTTGDALDCVRFFQRDLSRTQEPNVRQIPWGMQSRIFVRSSASIRGKSTRHAEKSKLFQNKDEKRRYTGTPSRERFDSQPVRAPRSSLLRGFRSGKRRL